MNRREHFFGSGLAMAVAAYYASGGHQAVATTKDRRLATATVAGGFGALCGSLPDIIEPAFHPNHRQFFHSVAFAIVLACDLRRLYRWQPEEPWQRGVRGVGLVAGGAYLVHLAMDATTTKSLPLVGRL